MAKNNTTTTKILSPNLFPVVGIGASAGGLNAFKELIKAIPEDSGMAYILIQHLAPHHESVLPEIMQKVTNIPVVEITNNIKVLPDHIYIIPENKLVTANDGVLELDAMVTGERLNTIDVFFASLAEVHQSYAIGVLLSGTGTDGTVGLKTIKDVGGYSIVQNDSAEYRAMPQNAINAGVVDFVMALHEMPALFKELVHTAQQIAPSAFNISEENLEDEVFRQILAIIKAKRGIDFSYYKQTTIRRRILRRKALNRIEKLEDYQLFLIENKAEQEALYKDILIPITAFFRDPETFDFLCATALPELFKEKPAAEPVRIWVAGCSTGEEAYSMAICLYEYFNDKPTSAAVQIFATDVSESAIAKARSGIYQKKDMAGVSETRIKQFFTKIDGSYQVNKAIREMVVFATQNFLKDPPFAKLDLVSCRNVLIYMQPYLQKKALTTFQYALNNKGMLLLGKSESIGASQEFSLFKKQDKFYLKKPFTGKYVNVSSSNNEASLKKKDVSNTSTEKKDDFQKAAEDALLAKYNSVGVIVNEQLDIIQFRGSTGAYLEAPPGKASHNLLKMAKEGLSFELRNALHKAKSGKGTVRKDNIPLEHGARKASIEVLPLNNTIETYFLVLFEDSVEPNEVKASAKNKKIFKEDATSTAVNMRIGQLEKELAQAREDMRAITEEQEAVNEELQSANEELLSGSEELQTLNEELETSKEEIQSSNEELTIINQELIERNEQLVHARKYSEAIVTTIHEPLIILTKDFRIKSANKSFYEFFNTTEQQTEGKVFFEWREGVWNVPELRERLEKIVPQHFYFEDLEITVANSEKIKTCMLLNGRQLINNASEEQLILLAMEDISVRKEFERKQNLFAQELELQVAERTKELKEANTQLQYSNDNLQQFASIAAHDLQEPLRKIKTFTSILNKNYNKDINDEGKDVINKISIAANRMSQLIREVLEYTKVVQANKIFEPTNLDAVVKKVMGDLDLLINETKAEIIYKEPLPVIDAIPLQMNQLFYNLASNALKFCKPLIPPLIDISYKMLVIDEVKNMADLNADLSYIEIKFSDNGIGFAQEFAEQIFQIFERLYTADEFEGTGIGLALCKKIIENHNGDIYALSKENEGAAFYVILPLKQ